MNKIKLLLTLCIISHFNEPSAKPKAAQPFEIISHAKTVHWDIKKTYIIGCDISMTEVCTGVFEIVHQQPRLIIEFKTPTKQIQNFTDYFTLVMTHIHENHLITISQACFASPGNTNATKDYIKHDHLFEVNGAEIKRATKLDKILIVNDFEVVGFGIQAIDQKHIKVIHEGRPRPKGTKVIIGAGNGLGTGLMLWNEKWNSYAPSPISYSFVEFSPQSPLELQLNDFLQQNTGSRSWGKVLGAGGGIVKIYDFLNLHKTYETAPKQYQPEQYLELFTHHTDQRCKDAVELYMKLYARLIRNVSYAQLPYNGVFITNAVAENNPELIKNPTFLQEILKTDNGYLSNYLSEIPIYLVEKTDGLRMYGAALYALVYQPA